ncbi:hypothetical protein [Streptomyces sp. NBC_00474]|uniref:hypothetical protein n=1 Tax=Streptomyces sp. NBC_00474 TaxID=2975754 RepID=UPI002254DBCF|nr:hypothetical protein [Streptomyces sp. NBC_00474]MCX5055070.1 hypothetical protein [Streptomyces sp. NBC_00474]
MSELAIDTGDGGRVIDLRREPDAADRLPRGKAGGRYRCCACGTHLIFTGPATPGSGFTPRFRHDGSAPGADRCGAPAPHQADVQADLTVILDLRDQLVHALPGATICLQIDPQLAGQRWELPPALIVRRGDDVVIIERPRRLLAKAAVDTRLKSVRTQHGEGTTHWWFFDRDDALHYDPAGTLKVRPHGKPDTHHKVRPTPVQRQIIQAGAAVCWITKDTVLIPYGGHPGTYPVRAGEDWSGEMASWSKDWKISHPYPADGAAWWGLVPLHLLTLGQRTGFRPAAAFQLMTALESAQHGREAHRRRLAREHAQRQTDQHVTVAPAPLPLEAPADSTPAEPELAPTQPPADTTTAAACPPLPPRPLLPPTTPPQAPLPRVPAARQRFSWSSLLPRRWRR